MNTKVTENPMNETNGNKIRVHYFLIYIKYDLLVEFR